METRIGALDFFILRTRTKAKTTAYYFFFGTPARAEFFAILGLLALFEFINLFNHPYLANITNHSPVLMLIILIAIGALLIPLHHKLEKWITKIMIEKNKKIRLEAAKKTIAKLEGKQTN